jgi:RNA polymerase sigma-70 factor (ECF subfamily)
MTADKASPVTERNATGEELFSRYLSTGENNPFEDLVALYEDELARYLYGIVGDYYEAKQLTIETFAQLAVNGKKFSGRSTLKTYLFTIGKNLAARYIRERIRERHIPFEDAIATLTEDGDSPYASAEREETRNRVRSALRELKDDYRVVLTLLYFEDMSYLETGRAMRKSDKQIKHLAYRAKAALKKKLESDFSR